MTQYLPPNLLALFAPRDPIPYYPPLDKLPHEKKLTPYTGVAEFLNQFEDPKDTPPPTRVETKDERIERKRKERAEQVAYKLEQDLALWDPHNDPQATGDPFKSLFVGRINYDTSESKLRREFEVYGPVKRINMVVNKLTSKPRGYAFVEYEHERDMHYSRQVVAGIDGPSGDMVNGVKCVTLFVDGDTAAYKHADGKKIDSRRVLVDVERSRTVKGWRPRRLGGGLGGTRKGGPEVNTKYSGRDDGTSMHRDREDRSASPRESRGGGGRRDRSRSPRERKRARSRSPRDRKRARSRSRDRDRESRRDRDRERERAAEPRDEKKERFDDDMGVDEERSRRKRRSRSPRDRKRSRSPRDRKRKRSRSRERSRRGREGRGGGDGETYNDEYGNIQVKEEPNGEGYDQYAAYAQSAPPPAEDEKFQNYAIKPPPEDDDEDENPPPPADAPAFPQYPQTNEYGSYQED